MAFNAIPGFAAPPGVQQQFKCEVLSGLLVVVETHRDTWQEQAEQRSHAERDQHISWAESAAEETKTKRLRR